jgi:hypothetical protein
MMTPEIESAIAGFKTIILGGVPILLQRNETAFLSFMCSLSALDALSGYRSSDNDVSKRYAQFIADYFPSPYQPHADDLYVLRCRMLHNFSPARFVLRHAAPLDHLKHDASGVTMLSDEVFFHDLREGALLFFDEVSKDRTRQDTMNARLTDVARGGAIFSPDF